MNKLVCLGRWSGEEGEGGTYTLRGLSIEHPPPPLANVPRGTGTLPRIPVSSGLSAEVT